MQQAVRLRGDARKHLVHIQAASQLPGGGQQPFLSLGLGAQRLPVRLAVRHVPNDDEQPICSSGRNAGLEVAGTAG